MDHSRYKLKAALGQSPASIKSASITEISNFGCVQGLNLITLSISHSTLALTNKLSVAKHFCGLLVIYLLLTDVNIYFFLIHRTALPITIFGIPPNALSATEIVAVIYKLLAAVWVVTNAKCVGNLRYALDIP